MTRIRTPQLLNLLAPLAVALATSLGGTSSLAQRIGENPKTPAPPPVEVKPVVAKKPVPIRMVYGTEKKEWLTKAKEAYEAANQGYTVELVGMGSLEGGQAAIKAAKDQSAEAVHVWSPASKVFQRMVTEEGVELLSDTQLVISPLVIGLFAEHEEALLSRLRKDNEDKEVKPENVTLGMLLKIMNKDKDSKAQQWAEGRNWGNFKLGFTNPYTSNSGFMVALLAAHDFHKTNNPLKAEEVTNQEFNKVLTSMIELARIETSSTGDLMKDMLAKANTYTAIVVYENLAISYVDKAKGRAKTLKVIYPNVNFYTDHPYYIVKSPKLGADQEAAARKFLAFLMSKEQQESALRLGFRPGNLDVGFDISGSPLAPGSKYEAHGIRADAIEKVTFAEPPARDALLQLIERVKTLMEEKQKGR